MLGGIVRGKRVTLRTTTESDLADHLRWHADAEATRWMPERVWPGLLDGRAEWLKETARDPLRLHWEIEAEAAHIGYCAARLVPPPMVDSWDITSLFLAPDARGHGFGGDAARAQHRYLIDYLGLAHGYASLYWDDATGRRLAASLGYVEYAHGHDVFYRAGRYWDDWRGILRAADFRSRFPDEIEYPDGPSRAPREDAA
jgi:RimJ/RimL family protein N-acetyltransferase